VKAGGEAMVAQVGRVAMEAGNRQTVVQQAGGGQGSWQVGATGSEMAWEAARRGGKR